MISPECDSIHKERCDQRRQKVYPIALPSIQAPAFGFGGLGLRVQDAWPGRNR